MGPTTPFKIGHKWGGYFYHFTARVYFFTFTLRLKEKLLRLNIFYDYRLRFVNFFALRLNLFAVSGVWVNPIKNLLKLENRLMMEKNKFFTPKIRKGKKGYPFPLRYSWESERETMEFLESFEQYATKAKAISHPSLVHSSRSVQQSKTVQFPKQFSHSSLCFLVDQVW